MSRVSLHLQTHSNVTESTIDAENGMRVDFSIHGAHHIVERRKHSNEGFSIKVKNTTDSELPVKILHGYKPWSGTVGAGHYYNPDDLTILIPPQHEADLWPTIHRAGGLGRFARDNNLSFDIDFSPEAQGLPITLSYS